MTSLLLSYSSTRRTPYATSSSLEFFFPQETKCLAKIKQQFNLEYAYNLQS